MKINQIVGEATGDPLGTVSAAPDASGKIKIKTPTGTEIETTKDALLPGAKPGTVQMKPDAAGDQLKPGTQVVSAEAMGDISTMPTTEFVKGIYAAAAENGMDAPDVEAVKKQMVLAPNGEVDIIATMQKAVQVFQSPEWKQMLADLDALVKRAEAQQPNAELSRIQELAGISEASNDTNDAIHAWNDKYSKYSGTNGPDLVNGWIDGMTSSGIISDGWEENEVYELEQRLGKEMGEWEPEDYDYVSDNEDTLLPISTAMVEELASILGVDAVGEEEANQVANILYGSTDESTGELTRIQELAGIKENTASQPPVKVPPVPKLPAQDGDQGDGSKLTTNPDGTKTYAGAFGRFTFDKSGKAIKYAAPQFTGVAREVDLTSGDQTTNYSTGPMNSTQTTDAKGNVVSSNTEYDLGVGKMAMGQDAKGIKSKTYTPADGAQSIASKDMYALGNKDKESTYNRAMAQVSGTPVKESPELTAMLSIAGLR